MYNFRPERWNQLNKERSWSFYQGDSGHGTVKVNHNGEVLTVGFSYFLHVQDHYEEMMSEVFKKHEPPVSRSFFGEIKRFFSSERQDIQDDLIREKIRQGFASTTLSVSISPDGEASFLPELVERLKAEIKSAKHEFLMANGYSKNLYKIYIEDEKIKIKRYTY